jgi:hypothetical protein
VFVSVAQKAAPVANGNAHVFKLTAGSSTFGGALGTSAVTITDASLSASEAVVALWFDTDTNEAVFGTWRNSTTGGNQLNALDTFTEAGRIDMTAADFAALNNTDFLLFA